MLKFYIAHHHSLCFYHLIGMPGTAVIDIILRMKNFPPTDKQEEKLTSINFTKFSQAPHTENDLIFTNHGKVFDSDEPIKRLDYGQVVLHFLSVENGWPKKPIAYAEYLKTHEEAFNKYRDVKIEGAKLQAGKTSDNPLELIFKYKGYKRKVALDLTEEAIKWAYVDGNLSLPY